MTSAAVRSLPSAGRPLPVDGNVPTSVNREKLIVSEVEVGASWNAVAALTAGFRARLATGQWNV